jgi:hypothetical protein
MNFFFAKNGTIFGGSTPAVAPEGDLVFREKAESPFVDGRLPYQSSYGFSSG